MTHMSPMADHRGWLASVYKGPTVSKEEIITRERKEGADSQG